MTKTQARRSYQAILAKSGKLWESGVLAGVQVWRMSTPDYIAIEKIVMKYLKKF
jgi:hypothetical protein